MCGCSLVPALDRDIAAQVHFEAQLGQHGGFDAAGAVGLLGVGRIDDLDVVRLVARHHLVARDAVEHGVHDGPLRGGLAPAAFGLLLRQLHDFATRRGRSAACRP